MSYDFQLSIGSGEDTMRVGNFEKNYTYNVSPMFYEALPGDDGMHGINGLSVSDALPRLDAGIASMKADPEKYRAMNPENGWGDYEGALECLEQLADACREAADIPGVWVEVF